MHGSNSKYKSYSKFNSLKAETYFLMWNISINVPRSRFYACLGEQSFLENFFSLALQPINSLILNKMEFNDLMKYTNKKAIKKKAA